MAGQRASGSMIWNLSINDAKALTSLRTMKSEVRSASNEWRALATQQSASGDMSASVRTKVSGLSEAVAKQKEYVEALSHVLKNSSQETDKDKRVYEQWRAQLNAGKASLARMNAELKESQSIMIRYDSGVVGLAQKHKSLNEALETNVKRLQAVGKEEEASAMQTLKYQKQVEGLTDQYYRERKVMQEMVKVSGRNSKAYQEQLVRVNGLRLKLAETENTQKRYNTGIDQLVEKTHQVNNAVGSFVEKMKAEGRAFTAQAIELKQLTAKHSALVKTYKLEQQELVKIGKNSGILSKAYLEQSTKVNKLGSQVAHTGSQVQKLDQRVGGLSTKMLKAGDRAVIMSKKYAGTSKALANISRGAANVSLGLGYMVTQGVKESTKLERSYVKTKNLLVTADDESTKHISVNVGKMKGLARKMSVQYGKSQYDIAEAMQTLVKRGYSSNQALSAMKPLLQGAAASGDSLNDVLSVTTSSMEAFGLRSKNSATMLKNTKKAINEMTYAADMTSTDFGKMGVGLTYVASTAHTAGISMSETASAIGVLSNNGIEADKAKRIVL